jgi:RNA polymerase sigma factor (sigma-70 family)
LKYNPEELLDELLKRTRYLADKKMGKKYFGVRRRDEHNERPKLCSDELGDLAEDKFYDVCSRLFDFSQLPIETISKLQSFPYDVWYLVDKEVEHTERRQYKDLELVESIEKVEGLFEEQDEASDSFKIQRLLEQNQSKLTERQLTVIHSIYFKNRTQTSIAEELGIDESVVREHKKAALKKLKSFLC